MVVGDGIRRSKKKKPPPMPGHVFFFRRGWNCFHTRDNNVIYFHLYPVAEWAEPDRTPRLTPPIGTIIKAGRSYHCICTRERLLIFLSHKILENSDGYTKYTWCAKSSYQSYRRQYFFPTRRNDILLCIVTQHRVNKIYVFFSKLSWPKPNTFTWVIQL